MDHARAKLHSPQSDPSLVMQIGALVEARTGLAVSTQLRAELDLIVNDLSQGNLDSYLVWLQKSAENEPIWQLLIRALTIGETYFFRGTAHFDLLKNTMLPDLVKRRREEGNLTLNLWSAGCATGEEPYSLAIAVHEFLPDPQAWQIRVIGTDINGYALRFAQQGLYRNWAFRHTRKSFRQRYFDTTPDGTRLKGHIRNMVSFQRANVLGPTPLPRLDIIFCRNMLLYFNKQHVDAVEDRLYGALAPAGWLLLGQAESIRSKRERWIMHIYPGTVVYQKPEPDLSLRAGEVAYRTRISTTAPRGNNDSNEFPGTDEGGSSLVPTYSNAVDAFQDDRLEAAERYLAELLIRHPGHARAHALLATIFANRQAIPEAHAHLSMALEADPLLADAHYLHALLHFEEGLVDNARKSLHAALYCQPEHPLAAFMLGNLYAANGHLPQAYRAWNNARRATTHLDPEAYVSDLSDLTVANFDTLVNHQLEGVD